MSDRGAYCKEIVVKYLFFFHVLFIVENCAAEKQEIKSLNVAKVTIKNIYLTRREKGEEVKQEKHEKFPLLRRRQKHI